MNTIEGVVEEIKFRNESNGYTVCEIRQNSDVITVVGFIPFVHEGESLRVTGRWVTHPDYGTQLRAEYFEKIGPTTVDSIEKYLASGMIKGIGPKIARKIVEKFGQNSLFIIENNPEELSLIKGISLNKALEIRECFLKQRELKEVIMFLQQYDINSTYAVKIYKHFGENTISQIKENPYKLADEIFGIGFKTADKIAMNLGIDKNSEYRLCAGIKYILSQFSTVGHTFMPKEELIACASRLLDSDTEMIENTLIKLTLEKQIYIENIQGIDAVYLASFYFAELWVSKKLLDLSLIKINNDIDIDEQILQIEKEQNIELEELQKLAIKEALKNGVIVITGGPGTGKTTIINSMLKLFDKLKYKVALAAPTGRAAKRMSEACQREAKTIHRLLEIGYIDDGGDQYFAKNEANPLDYDVVIVDEVSMVDIILMSHLLKAIPYGTRLILVGDTDQLPSVGPGRVLKDIIDSETIKVVRLTEIFRQAQESMIVVNAHRINKGEYPYLNTGNNDFFLIKKYTEESILSEIINLVANRIPKYNNYDHSAIQVLTPTRKGLIGVINLNNELQKVLNPQDKSKKEKKFRQIIFREGDKVMQIKNNYSTIWRNILTNEEGVGVFNGDIGFVKSIDDETQTMTVIFDDMRQVIYDYNELEELELAYAITVHKSQGCEFPVIIMPVFSGPPLLLTRNLLYTAITRAKELVVLVGREEYIKAMIENNNESKRYSGLKEKLKSYINKY